ncbi:MAG: sterol desaturase family protein [Isosphaeraceae bacterium]
MQAERVIRRALLEIQEFSLGAGLWYLLLAGLAWLLLYVLLRRRVRHRKINPEVPERGQIPREIALSLRSLLIFGLVSGVVAALIALGWKSQLYRPIDRHGRAWYWASLGICIVLHDTYFYWTHRLMHHPRLFRLVHRAHHLSDNPAPWAAYSFSIPEAIVQALIGPILIYAVPMHFSVFLLFMVWQVAFNVYGHCGHELAPRWFLRSPLGWLLNTPTHHTQHHEKYRSNFGLYFNAWDRLMGTNNPGYERRFREVTKIVPGEPNA